MKERRIQKWSVFGPLALALAGLGAACGELSPGAGEPPVAAGVAVQAIGVCEQPEPPPIPCYRTTCNATTNEWEFAQLAPGIRCNGTGTCSAEGICVMPDPPPPPVPPPPIGPTRELTTGRLANLAVSWYFSSHITITGSHQILVRAVCDETDGLFGRCDPGLLVSYGARSWYNDDDATPAAHGAGPRGSFLALDRYVGAPSDTVTYDVRAFSMRRATTRTTVDFSFDGGATWIHLSEPRVEVGGAVVRVGAIAAGDFLEVQTRGHGAGDEDTHLTLFDPAGAPAQPLAFNDNLSPTDRDPKLIATAAWPAGTLALVGKATRSSRSNASVETHGDLVHGPLGSGLVSRTACGGVCGADLVPGRYLLSLYATTSHPVGILNGPTGNHPSSNMPVMSNDGCPKTSVNGHDAATWMRGQPNDVALRIQVERFTPAGWVVVGAPRIIPRGAFGSDPTSNLPYNRFAMPLDVGEPGAYRIASLGAASDVTVYASWSWERNPEATELTAVSYNTLFRSEAWDTPKYQNTADLLGTRGSVIASELRVEERASQAPFQWDADILGFQEVIKEFSSSRPGNKYTDVMRDELLLRGSHAWTYVQGRGESWATGAGDGPGMNPIFVRGNAHPAVSPDSVFFSAAAKAAAGCRGSSVFPPSSDSNHPDPDEPYFMECALNQPTADLNTTNYTTAAKATAWRGSNADRPIAVFNVHLRASDGPDKFGQRVDELRTLMNKIDALLAADHRAFNRAPESDPSRSSPRHSQNRAIIVGDWNIRAHECGEHYWFLRMLRERYGYALDVSMARADSTGSLKQAMHLGDRGYGPDDVPLGFQHMFYDDPRVPPAWTAWGAAPDHSPTSAFPWWATDWRGRTRLDSGAGERLSMIVLVGQGWAYDDPVQSYEIMADTALVSPMNPTGRAVEMWQPDSCDERGTVPDEDDHGYAPNYGLKCVGGTKRGAPALHSDHKPMAARLRVWTR